MFLLEGRLLVLIGGPVSCSYWRSGFLFLLMDRLLVHIGGAFSCSYWRDGFLFLLEGRFLVLTVFCWCFYRVVRYHRRTVAPRCSGFQHCTVPTVPYCTLLHPTVPEVAPNNRPGEDVRE